MCLSPHAVFEPDPFPRFPWRRRLLILALALATSTTVLVYVMLPPAGSKRHGPVVTPDAARCAAGQTTDCVGGTAAVIVAPLPAPASAPASAPR